MNLLRAAVAVLVAASPLAAGQTWRPLDDDGLHDPTGSGIVLLQEPGEALSTLPPGAAGNNVDWVEALRTGAIAPRTNIYPETQIEVLHQNVVYEDTGDMPLVVFPHKAHTEWLDCVNCHDRIFEKGKDQNQFGMFEILSGRYCGQCHGAVAFPLTECDRCHAMPRASRSGTP